MNIKSRAALSAAVLLFAVSCIPPSGKKLKITGAVRLVGNEPFTKLVLSTTNKMHYYFPIKMKKKYMKYLNHIVELTGYVKKEILRSADHKFKFIRRRLISIDSIRKIRGVF